MHGTTGAGPRRYPRLNHSKMTTIDCRAQGMFLIACLDWVVAASVALLARLRAPRFDPRAFPSQLVRAPVRISEVHFVFAILFLPFCFSQASW